MFQFPRFAQAEKKQKLEENKLYLSARLSDGSANVSDVIASLDEYDLLHPEETIKAYQLGITLDKMVYHVGGDLERSES